MTLGAASRCVASILGQVGRLCPKSTLLGRKQERYVGYAGIEFGSIPASLCVSTAFQRGMTRRDAAPSVNIMNQPLGLNAVDQIWVEPADIIMLHEKGLFLCIHVHYTLWAVFHTYLHGCRAL